MAASPPTSYYNYWANFESQFEAEESMIANTMGSNVQPFIGDVWSSKEQNMVVEANCNRASSEYAVENATTLVEDPPEQGGLMPHIPIDVDAFNDDVLCYPLAATPPSSLDNHWVDFESLYGEEESMNITTKQLEGHPSTGDVWSSKKRKIGDASCNRASSESAMIRLNTLAIVAYEQGGSTPHVPVDPSDDDVLVSSSRDFARAKNKSRRTLEQAVIIDVESEERMHTVAPSSQDSDRRIPSGQTIIDCDLYESLEGPMRITEEIVEKVQPPPALPLPPPPPPPPPTPPIEPTFSCPICMNSIEEAMTTKCGHIFCKACLKAAISAQKKCPTCRSKVTTMRSTLRVYLPSTR